MIKVKVYTTNDDNIVVNNKAISDVVYILQYILCSLLLLTGLSSLCIYIWAKLSYLYAHKNAYLDLM